MDADNSRLKTVKVSCTQGSIGTNRVNRVNRSLYGDNSRLKSIKYN